MNLQIKKFQQVNFYFLKKYIFKYLERELLKRIGSTISKYKAQPANENANSGKDGKKRRKKKK